MSFITNNLDLIISRIDFCNCFKPKPSSFETIKVIFQTKDIFLQINQNLLDIGSEVKLLTFKLDGRLHIINVAEEFKGIENIPKITNQTTLVCYSRSLDKVLAALG